MSQQNNFARWSALGYKRLLPIVPPSAGELGQRKMPGVRDEYGEWRGIKDWNHYHAAEVELERWGEMGASVGLLATEDAFALDVDAHDPNVARQIETMARMLLGPAPKRVGREPKFALLYRTNETLKPQILRFDSLPEREGRPDRVEIPTQLVLDGMHPATRMPYSWPVPAGASAELTCVSAEQLAGFFGVLRGVLPITASLAAGVDREAIAQDELRGDPELVAKAIRSTPNSPDIRYEEWVRIAAALRGALPDDQELGLELFQEFSDRTHLPERLEDEERVYWSVLPPFGVGAAYLYDLAARTSSFGAELWFQEAPAPSAPEAKPASTGLYSVLGIDELLDSPPQKFLVDRHVPENALGFLYGAPGCGKSFLALDMGLHIAAGHKTWNSDPIASHGAVAYIAGEGRFGMGQRIRAWMAGRLSPGGDAEALRRNFGLLHEPINFMQPVDIKKLADTLRARVSGQLALLIVDTVSRALPGADENLQKEMTLFVAACDALRHEFGCAVLGVHHAGKSGTMRGSTVLEGAGDFIFQLVREKGNPQGTLWCSKQKDAPDGWAEDYTFETKGPSLIVSRAGGAAQAVNDSAPSAYYENVNAEGDFWGAPG